MSRQIDIRDYPEIIDTINGQLGLGNVTEIKIEGQRAGRPSIVLVSVQRRVIAEIGGPDAENRRA